MMMNKKHYYDRTYRKNRAICIKLNPFCIRCGIHVEGEMTADHKVPISLGGSNDLSNLQTMCKGCNYGLGDKTGSKTKRITRLNPKWMTNERK